MVIITFLDEALTGSDAIEAENAWTALFQLVEQCAVETGLSDLAHQHDHYLHGQPKQEE